MKWWRAIKDVVLWAFIIGAFFGLLLFVQYVNRETARQQAEYQQALIDCAHRGPNFNYVKMPDGTHVCVEVRP